jgi:hypothetical protein
MHLAADLLRFYSLDEETIYASRESLVNLINKIYFNTDCQSLKVWESYAVLRQAERPNRFILF